MLFAVLAVGLLVAGPPPPQGSNNLPSCLIRLPTLNLISLPAGDAMINIALAPVVPILACLDSTFFGIQQSFTH